MPLLTDFERFVRDDCPHGDMMGDATKPVSNGYRLTVACACGVVFERWTSRGTQTSVEFESRSASVESTSSNYTI